MKVISTSNTKRLVKGAVYEVLKLDNLSMSGKNFRPSVIIKLNDVLSRSFSVKSFKLEDGSDLPEINWESDEWKEKTTDWSQGRIQPDNIKKGDYVVYRKNSHKNLIYGKKYKVEDINVINHKNTWGTSTHNWTEVQIKVEGSSRFYKSYSFRKCTPQEARDISLNVLFDQETGVEKVDENIRKIDKYDEVTKEKLLIKILLSSMLDSNRNNMSVTQWAINKIATQYSLKESDFTNLMNCTLETLITKL